MLKKIVSLVFLGILFFSLVPLAQAAPEVTVLVNNKKIAFPDQKPYIDKNNRTLVPVRFVSEALGADVDWKDETNTVIITQKEKTIVLKIGQSKATVNGQTKTFDTKAVIQNRRTMVPLRFVSECLGATVDWIAKTRTVVITVNNGYTIPGDPAVDVEVRQKNDPAKVEISFNIDTFYDLEAQFEAAEAIISSKFGISKAKTIIDHARLKTQRNDEVPTKFWTIGDQRIRVGSPAGYWAVSIIIWQPGEGL